MGAIAAITVPIKKTDMALRYIFLEPKRLINQAEIGIITPLTSKNAVESHSAVAVLILKERMIDGSAVDKRVPFKTVQKEPMIRTKTSKFRLYLFP
ncbi:hypothetical protein GCM10019817_11460 [Lactobacillus intestinalis]